MPEGMSKFNLQRAAEGPDQTRLGLESKVIDFIVLYAIELVAYLCSSLMLVCSICYVFVIMTAEICQSS
jgi:hypothetical protein